MKLQHANKMETIRTCQVQLCFELIGDLLATHSIFILFNIYYLFIH